MDVAASISEYRKFKGSITDEEPQAVVSICHMLHMPQSVVVVALYIFYTAKYSITLEPDDIVLHGAVISLACRIAENPRSTKHILSAAASIHNISLDSDLAEMYISSIEKTQMDLCICLDFDLEAPDFYTELDRCYAGRKAHTKCFAGAEGDSDGLLSLRRSRVFLNVVFFTALPIFFTATELAMGCLFLEHAAQSDRFKAPNTPADDSWLGDIFMGDEWDESIEPSAVLFIANELMQLYEDKAFAH